MNALVHTATVRERDNIASFGAGDDLPGGRAERRARGRAGNQVAPAGAVRSLTAAARRLAAQPGRGRAARRRILEEIELTSRRRRGGPRLTNGQVADFREMMNELRG